MALVAYDDSDLSDHEEEDSENTNTATLIKKVKEPLLSEPTTGNVSNATENNPSLFNFLPKPTNKKPAIEEDDEFLHRKEATSNIVKPKARITVPSLSDFKDIEGTSITKPKAVNGKKSGLLSILPEPKNVIKATTKSLIPQVVTQKPKPNANIIAKKNEPLPTPMKKANVETRNVLAINYSDESDNDEEIQSDFFSMNKPNDIPIEDAPLHIEETSVSQSELITNVTEPRKQRQTLNIQSYFKENEVTNHVELQSDHMDSNDNSEYQESGANQTNYAVSGTSNNSEAVLDDEAILKLCGTRGKRKREDIQIVDVNQQEVLADAREWLLKGLMDDTSKRVSSSKKKGNEPTSQQRRKHQITYLAHQAKANEIELQNQWANNRLTKRQTQSKYGF